MTGEGVTVALLDKGIKEHEDLNNATLKGDDEDDSFGGSNILTHQDMTGTSPAASTRRAETMRVRGQTTDRSTH